jgi:hypothetical protein
MSQFDWPITPKKKKKQTMETLQNKRFYFQVSSLDSIPKIGCHYFFGAWNRIIALPKNTQIGK